MYLHHVFNNENDNKKSFILTLTILINDVKDETENKRMWLPDVKRQTRNFYARGITKLLIRNFRYCTDNVKCYLVQSYCTSMYCCQLWFNSTKVSLKKLKTSYNSALRRFLVISKPYSASQMFVSREYYRLMNCYVNLFIVC